MFQSSIAWTLASRVMRSRGVIVTSPPKATKVLNDAIFAAASDLSKRERNRRRIVLVISDGQNSGNDHSYDETTKTLLQTGIQVYAIGLDQPLPFKKFSVLDDYDKATGGDAPTAGARIPRRNQAPDRACRAHCSRAPPIVAKSPARHAVGGR